MYSSGNSRPIYGDRTKTNHECICNVTPTVQMTLQNFLVLINTLKVSIEKYLPAVTVNMSLRGNIDTQVSVCPFIMTRLLCADRFPRVTRYKDNFMYRSIIKDFYYKLGCSNEWNNDPLSLIIPKP